VAGCRRRRLPRRDADLTVDRIVSTVGDANASQIHIQGTVSRAVLASYQVWIRYTFDVAEPCSDGSTQTSTLSVVGTPWTRYTTRVSGPGRWSADITFRAGTFDPNADYPSICGSAAYPAGPLTMRAVHLSVYPGPFSPPRTVQGKLLYHGFDIRAGSRKR
jgi:hypothetical protein